MQDALKAKALSVQKDIKAGIAPTSEYTEAMREYHRFVRSGPSACKCLHHRYAFNLAGNETKREIIEGLLLAKADFQQIFQVFEIPVKVLEIYQEMFFDTSCFLSKLDIYEYTSAYPTAYGKEIKVRAHMLGPDFLFYKYGNVIPRSEKQRDMIRQMFLSAGYRAMEANFNTTTSPVTKEALAWSKQMLQAFESIEKNMGDDGTGRNLEQYMLDRSLVDISSDGLERFDPDEPGLNIV